MPARVSRGDPVEPDVLRPQICAGAAQSRGRWPGLRLARCRGVQDLENAPGRGDAFHARVELRADRAKRHECLGGEQQHQERRLVAYVAVQQAEPDLDRDESGSYCGG